MKPQKGVTIKTIFSETFKMYTIDPSSPYFNKRFGPF